MILNGISKSAVSIGKQADVQIYEPVTMKVIVVLHGQLLLTYINF
jgi:hypothetical protein